MKRFFLVILLLVVLFSFKSSINALDSTVVSGEAYALLSENLLTNAGLYRGKEQDRQHMGIYMPAESSFMIRSTDGKEFLIDILNNDRETEKNGSSSYRIGSDWVKIEASVDSIPFFRTNYGDYDKVSYEIKNRDNTQDITVFTKGGNESQFFNKWDSNNQQYAVIEGDRINFLVPRVDKDRIIGNGEYGFSSIDEMLNWYDGVIDNYDSYVGLNKNATNQYDENYNYKFFMKADINGPGGASYRRGYYITHKGRSMEVFLRRSWGALHEIGHGYDHVYIYNKNSLNLYEVANNFFAYFEQLKYLHSGDGGFMWTNFTQEDLMAEIEKVNNYNDLVTENEYHFYERLFVFTNLFEKIDMKKAMAKASSEYRRIINEGSDIETADLYGIYFSKATGYNVIPYFNSIKIFPSTSVEEIIYSEKSPMVYPLAYIVNKTTATTIANNLNLRGIYSVVENNDIKNYINNNNITRNVKFNINTDDSRKLLNKTLYIKNSSGDIIKEQKILGNNITINSVPVGIYYIDISKGEVTNLNYLVVNEDSSVLIPNINYETDLIDGTENTDTPSNTGNTDTSSNTGNTDTPSNTGNTDTPSNTGNTDTSSNTENDRLTNVIDNDTEIDVEINYNYDPKNVNELGEKVKVPNTSKTSSTILIILGISIIILSIILLMYYLIKRNKFPKKT